MATLHRLIYGDVYGDAYSDVYDVYSDTKKVWWQ